MTTLTDFLLARIAEDEEEIDRLESEQARWMDKHIGVSVALPWFHAGRLRSECEAKRRIVELHAQSQFCERIALNDVMDALTLPYVHHPDYDEEWKP